MKKPEHLTFENYQGANSSHERSALVAEVFEYATKLDEGFTELSNYLGKRLAGSKMELAILDEKITSGSLTASQDIAYHDGFNRGQLKGRISELENTLRLPALMVTTNFISEICPCCNGTGKVEGPEPDDEGICLHCAGTGVKEAGMVNAKEVQPGIFAPGEIEKYTHTMTGFLKASETQDTCPSCGGTGKLEWPDGDIATCPTCDGAGTIDEKPKASLEARKATTLDMEELLARLNLTAPGVCAGYVSHRTPYTHDGKTFTLTISEGTMRNSPAATAILFKATTEFTNMDIVYKDNIGKGLPVQTVATRPDIDALIARLQAIHSEICGTVTETETGFGLDIHAEYLYNESTQAILSEALTTYSNLYLRNV